MPNYIPPGTTLPVPPAVDIRSINQGVIYSRTSNIILQGSDALSATPLPSTFSVASGTLIANTGFTLVSDPQDGFIQTVYLRNKGDTVTIQAYPSNGNFIESSTGSSITALDISATKNTLVNFNVRYDGLNKIWRR